MTPPFDTITQPILRPSGLVHHPHLREDPERHRAIPEGDHPRVRRSRQRALQTAVACRRQVQRCGPQLHDVRLHPGQPITVVSVLNQLSSQVERPRYD